ncbi:MAG: type II toxin-antitoxin system VapC family toxin [Thermaerobacter sp.]|nr:type II toxin-antitoxin system VapC family toxin [Thermaerobacter sp.]
MPEIIVDASAVLAYLQQEQGHDLVETALMDRAVISAVNLAEVVAKLTDGGMPVAVVEEVLDDLAMIVIPLDVSVAMTTGFFIAQTKPYGLSLGDRACLALATFRKSPVLTADRRWLALSLPLDIRLIRP